jgi:hypothetical protein
MRRGRSQMRRGRSQMRRGSWVGLKEIAVTQSLVCRHLAGAPDYPVEVPE